MSTEIKTVNKGYPQSIRIYGEDPNGATSAVVTDGNGDLLVTSNPLFPVRTDPTGTTTQPVSGSIIVEDVTDGAGTAVQVRTPNIFKKVQAVAITAGTPVAIWTPTSGKKFRLMGYSLGCTAAASILFEDTTGGANEFIRTPVLVAGGAANSPQMGNGFLSAAANNVLYADVTVTGTISGFVFGTEE